MKPVVRGAPLRRGGIALALVLWAQGANAQDVAGIDARVASIEGEVGQLSARYLQPAQLQRNFAFPARLSEGQVRYILGDYESAAIILVDLVENPAYRGTPGHADATWLLADSLFLARNYVVARSYFEDLVEANDPTWGLDAARRLLEVAFAMRDYSGLDALFEQMQARTRGAVGPEIAYVRGKAFYFQQRWDEAIGALSSVPADSALFERARYFVGTVRARQADYAAAEAEFVGVLERLSAIDEPDAETRDLLDLTRLAIGRIRYEQQRWDEAIASYGSVPRDSSRYDDALYEMAWSLIRVEQFGSAYDLLDILQIVATDRRLIPEAQLLQADLLMRQSLWEDAVVRFEEVANEYAAVESELREVAQSRRSPSEYFASLVDTDEVALRIPAQAQPWFRNDPAVESALQMVSDLAAMETTVAELRSIVEELEMVVSGRAGINVFPQWREGWGNAVELLATLTGVHTDLVNAERELVWPSMSADARARYEALRGAREALQQRYAQTPRTFTEMNERTARVVAALGEQSLEVYEGELEVDGMLAEIDALRDVVAERRRANTVDPNLAARWIEELDRLEAEAETHARTSVSFRDRIRIRQTEAGLADEVGQAEEQLRQQYLAALSTEAQFLSSFRGGAAGRSSGFAAIDDLRARALAAEQSVTGFFSQMDALVLETLAGVRTSLAEESAALTVYERRLEELQERSEQVAGAIAHRAFVETHRRFSDLTLRANLGIIDVAWEQKEDVSGRIEDLFEERNQALRVLDADFTELLDEN